jgi:hypothetical protein
METTNFIKLKMDLFTFNELTTDEIIILSFILSHLDNKQDFFYTDTQLVEVFNNKLGPHKIKRVLTSLDEKGFIQRENSKKHYDNHVWANRRTIILGYKLDNTLEVPSTKEEKIVSKVVKKEEVIDITPNIVKPSTIKEKVSKKPTNRMEFSNDFNDLLNSIDETDLQDYKFYEPRPKTKGGMVILI